LPWYHLAEILACLLDPTSLFVLTNTGTVPLTGIGQATLAGVDASEFSHRAVVVDLWSGGGGQFQAITTLAPGATCEVRVQFKPLTAQSDRCQERDGVGDQRSRYANLNPDWHGELVMPGRSTEA